MDLNEYVIKIVYSAAVVNYKIFWAYLSKCFIIMLSEWASKLSVV